MPVRYPEQRNDDPVDPQSPGDLISRPDRSELRGTSTSSETDWNGNGHGNGGNGNGSGHGSGTTNADWLDGSEWLDLPNQDHDEAVEPLYLISFSRYPVELRDALHSGPLLAPVRLSLRPRDATCKGAKLFCSVDQYEAVCACVKNSEHDVRPYHVLLTQSYREALMKTIKRCPSRKGVRVKHEVLLGFVPIPQGPLAIAEPPLEKSPGMMLENSAGMLLEKSPAAMMLEKSPAAIMLEKTPGMTAAVEAFLTPGGDRGATGGRKKAVQEDVRPDASSYWKAPGSDRRPEMVPELPLWRPQRGEHTPPTLTPTLLSPHGGFGTPNPPLPIGRMPSNQRPVYDAPEERPARSAKGGKKGSQSGAPGEPRGKGNNPFKEVQPPEARLPGVPTGAQMAAELVNVLRQTSAAPEQDQLADMFIQDLEKMVQQYRGNQAKATQSQVPPTPASTVPSVVAGVPASAPGSFFKPTRTENLLAQVPMPPHMGPMVPERLTQGGTTSTPWGWPDTFQPYPGL